MIVVPGATQPPAPDPTSRIRIVVDTPMRRFYEEHVALLDARDFDALVTTHYHEDAQILSTGYRVSGHAELLEHFAKYTGLMGFLKVLSTDKWVEGEHTFAFEATCRTQWGLSKVHDAFFLRDGRIVRHFTGSIPLVRFGGS
jgi:hypothetical protein